MKKNILLVVLAMTLFSCGGTKMVKASKKVIKGDWQLEKIDFSTYGNFRVIFFDDVRKNCLEGSSWSFVPNNSTGIYTIDNEGCKTGDRHFIFTIQAVDPQSGFYDFLMKPTNEKYKSENNDRGFRLSLTKLTDTDMQWEQRASIDGKTIEILMNFKKNIKK